MELAPSLRGRLLNGVCNVAVYAAMCPPADARANAARIAAERLMAAFRSGPNG